METSRSWEHVHRGLLSNSRGPTYVCGEPFGPSPKSLVLVVRRFMGFMIFTTINT